MSIKEITSATSLTPVQLGLLKEAFAMMLFAAGKGGAAAPQSIDAARESVDLVVAEVAASDYADGH